jgi:hypothetical protein
MNGLYVKTAPTTLKNLLTLKRRSVVHMAKRKRSKLLPCCMCGNEILFSTKGYWIRCEFCSTKQRLKEDGHTIEECKYNTRKAGY